MQLRWLEKQYPSPTVQAIREYQNLHACGPIAAKQALKTPDEEVLQFFDGKDWIDIPTVTVKMEAPKKS